MRFERVGNAESQKRPMSSQEQKKFLFDHLPKTGGTAFRTVLEGMFGQKNVTPHLEGRSESWATERYSAHRVISGHFVSHLPGNLHAGGRARITILRHPVDRAISEYFYRRHHSFEGVDDKLARWAQQYDICTFFRMRDESDETAVRNLYTKHFSTRVSRRMGSKDSLLSAAKEALEKYDFVGISEQMQESMDVFCWQFSLPPVEEVPLVNVTSVRPGLRGIDPAAVSALQEMNDLDFELYEFARALLEGKKRRLIHELVRDTTAARTPTNTKEHLRGFGRFLPGSFLRPSRGGRASNKETHRSPHNARVGDEKAPAAETSKQPDNGTSRPLSENFGNGLINIQGAHIAGAQSGTNAVAPGESVRLKLRILAGTNEPNLTVGMEIRDVLGEVVFGTNTYLQKKAIAAAAGHEYEITFVFPANLNRGRYDIGAALHTGADHAKCCYHWCDQVAQFDVVQLGEPDFVGYCRLDPRIEWNELTAGTPVTLDHAETSMRNT